MAEMVKLSGLRESVAALRALPSEIAGHNGGPLRGALFAGTKVMHEEVVRRAPEESGNLKRNIIIFRDRDPRSSGMAEHYMIVIRVGRRSRRVKKAYRVGRLSPRLRALGGADAWYGIFPEFGTAKMPAHPFMRPAFEEKKMAAVSTFIVELRKGVARAAQRAKARSGR